METSAHSSVHKADKLKLEAKSAFKEEPHYLSDKKETTVASTIPYALFSVQINVRHTVESNKNRVMSARNAYVKLVCKKCDLKRSDAVIARARKGAIYITGFAVGEVRGFIRIITSSQGIKEALPLTYSSSLIEDVNLAFKFDVMCLHEEQQEKQAGRSYLNARLLCANGEKGLLILEADVSRICGKDHPFIRQVPRLGPEDVAQEVFLHGSPRHRGGSFACGRVSNISRDYKDLGCPNECKYNMKLIEVFGLCCSEGFAGAPVVNVNSRFIGAFHTSCNGYGYVINGEHIADLFLYGLAPQSLRKEEDVDGRKSKRQKIRSRGGVGISGIAAPE